MKTMAAGDMVTLDEGTPTGRKLLHPWYKIDCADCQKLVPSVHTRTGA